jgi:hypothetical protein
MGATTPIPGSNCARVVLSDLRDRKKLTSPVVLFH